MAGHQRSSNPHTTAAGRLIKVAVAFTLPWVAILWSASGAVAGGVTPSPFDLLTNPSFENAPVNGTCSPNADGYSASTTFAAVAAADAPAGACVAQLTPSVKGSYVLDSYPAATTSTARMEYQASVYVKGATGDIVQMEIRETNAANGNSTQHRGICR